MPTIKELQYAANEFFKKKRFSRAYQIYMFLAKKDPDNEEYRIRLAESCVGLNCANDAVKIYKHLAAVLLQKGNAVKAISINKRILEIDPSETEIQRRLEQLVGKEDQETSKTEWQKTQAQARKQVEKLAKKKLELPVESLELAGPGDRVTSSVSEMAAFKTGRKNESPQLPPSGLELADDQESKSSLTGLADSLALGFRHKKRTIDLSQRPKKPIRKATKIPKIPLFSELPPGVFSKVMTRFQRRMIQAGKTIVQQGDRGNSLFVLASGVVHVVQEVDGKREICAQLKPGESFGEFPFFAREHRETSVIASNMVEVLELSRKDMEEIIKETPLVEEVMRNFYKESVLKDLLKKSPLFSTLSEKDVRNFLEKFSFKTLSPNQIVVKEGDPPDAFYVIQSGRVKVTKGKNGKELAQLHPGDFFGEYGMITGDNRSATVSTIEKTELVLFTRPLFKEFLRGRPKIVEKLRKIAKARLANQ